MRHRDNGKVKRAGRANRKRYGVLWKGEGLQPALAVTRSFTPVFFCRALTMLKRFSVLGLPRGANIRCRLLLGFLIAAASSSKPSVALTRSRRMALPAAVSPLRNALIASVRSASRKRGSRCARAATVFLKSRVSAIQPPLPRSRTLATAIRRPALFRHLNRVLLALLGAATEQDDHAVAILAEIDSVAWAEGDLPLEHARTDALDVRTVAGSQLVQRRRNLRRRRRVETVEPGAIGGTALGIEIFEKPNRRHYLWQLRCYHLCSTDAIISALDTERCGASWHAWT